MVKYSVYLKQKVFFKDYFIKESCLHSEIDLCICNKVSDVLQICGIALCVEAVPK